MYIEKLEALKIPSHHICSWNYIRNVTQAVWAEFRGGHMYMGGWVCHVPSEPHGEASFLPVPAIFRWVMVTVITEYVISSASLLGSNTSIPGKEIVESIKQQEKLDSTCFHQVPLPGLANPPWDIILSIEQQKQIRKWYVLERALWLQNGNGAKGEKGGEYLSCPFQRWGWLHPRQWYRGSRRN